MIWALRAILCGNVMVSRACFRLWHELACTLTPHGWVIDRGRTARETYAAFQAGVKEISRLYPEERITAIYEFEVDEDRSFPERQIVEYEDSQDRIILSKPIALPGPSPCR